MIGQVSGVCQFTVCEGTDTRLYYDDFKVMDSKGKITIERKQVHVCKEHTRIVVAGKLAGEALRMSAENWFYLDNWQWLLYTA